MFIQKIFNQPWEDIHKTITLAKEKDGKTIFFLTVPYLLSLNPTFRNIEKEERLNSVYELLNKHFIDTKKLDYILCLGNREEEELLLGTEKIGIKITLVAKEDATSLYKVVK